MRLDKYLTLACPCTRSEAKKYIKQKRISVNGSIATCPEIKINEKDDDVCLDNKSLFYEEFEYYMLNKPSGYVSATTDNRDKTVVSLIKSDKKDLFPVGRLDKDTEGLLIITNDGKMAHDLLSPKKHVDKRYYAKIKGIVTDATVQTFAMGIQIEDDFITLPAKLEIVSSDDISEVYVTIREGKFHQIKRMFKAVNMEVVYLKRMSMKNLVLDESLSLGEYRRLTHEEIKDLLAK